MMLKIPSSPTRQAGPAPTEIAALRASYGLTQTQAATLLHTSGRTWRKWELGERAMQRALWDCVRLKLGIDIERESIAFALRDQIRLQQQRLRA